jgi:hypothetical protein
MTQPTTIQANVRYYPALGGPLVLVSMGLVISFALLLRTVFLDSRLILLEENWREIATPGGRLYHPLMPTFFFISLGGSVCLLVLLVIVSRSYFWKRRNGPRWVIAYMTCNLAFAWSSYLLLLRNIPPLNDRVGNETLARLGIATGWCAIFIPYFLWSKRVKGTFVH